jgi:hypothetical protein
VPSKRICTIVIEKCAAIRGRSVIKVKATTT